MTLPAIVISELEKKSGLILSGTTVVHFHSLLNQNCTAAGRVSGLTSV